MARDVVVVRDIVTVVHGDTTHMSHSCDLKSLPDMVRLWRREEGGGRRGKDGRWRRGIWIWLLLYSWFFSVISRFIQWWWWC